MSFLRIVNPTLLKSGGTIFRTLERSISLSMTKLYPGEGEDPTPRLRHRMAKVIRDESYYIKQRAVGLDPEAIDKVVYAAQTCMKHSLDLPRLKECIKIAESHCHKIENPKLRQQLRDVLERSKNIRPRY